MQGQAASGYARTPRPCRVGATAGGVVYVRRLRKAAEEAKEAESKVWSKVHAKKHEKKLGHKGPAHNKHRGAHRIGYHNKHHEGHAAHNFGHAAHKPQHRNNSYVSAAARAGPGAPHTSPSTATVIDATTHHTRDDTEQ